MRIATWNVNSLTARLQHVLDWLIANPVDVLCLQELKLTDDKFPLDVLKSAGYDAAVFGQKTYNGVAILSRAPVRDVLKNIGGFADEQSRVIAATVDTPASGMWWSTATSGQRPRPSAHEKFEYKMSWMNALREWLRQEMAAHPNLVLLGDFNIVLEDRDSFDPIGLAETIHYTTAERDQFKACSRWPDRRLPPVRPRLEKAFHGGPPCSATRRTAASASTTFSSAHPWCRTRKAA